MGAAASTQTPAPKEKVEGHTIPDEVDYETGIKVVEELHELKSDEEKQQVREVLTQKWAKDGEEYSKMSKADFLKAYDDHYAAPAEAEPAKAEGEAAPAEGEAAPAEGEAAPAEGEAAKVEGEAAPAEGEAAAPAEGEAAKAEGEAAAPAEGEAAAPAEGEAAKAEGETAATEGEASS